MSLKSDSCLTIEQIVIGPGENLARDTCGGKDVYDVLLSREFEGHLQVQEDIKTIFSIIYGSESLTVSIYVLVRMWYFVS